MNKLPLKFISGVIEEEQLKCEIKISIQNIFPTIFTLNYYYDTSTNLLIECVADYTTRNYINSTDKYGINMVDNHNAIISSSSSSININNIIVIVVTIHHAVTNRNTDWYYSTKSYYN